MATAPVHGVPGESFAHCFNEIAFNLVRGQFSQNPTVLVNRDVVERPGVRIHVTADIGIFRRQPPSGVRENAGGLPPLVMVEPSDISGTLHS
ncbi:hypothetical protein AVR70_00160 [Escherichia coli]|nr:hypothetical protein AVR70_00160 [Escherichia coli]